MFKVMDAISKFEDLSVEKLKKIRDGFDVCKDDKRIFFLLDCTANIPMGYGYVLHKCIEKTNG